MADLRPSLWRVAVATLAISAAANVMLLWISGDDDWFANVVAVASGLVAVALVASAVVRRLARWREEALLVALAVWVANLIEFATQAGASTESKLRQCGFYAAFAVLAAGTYVAQRLERQPELVPGPP